MGFGGATDIDEPCLRSGVVEGTQQAAAGRCVDVEGRDVVEVGGEIVCAGVTVREGDYVLADLDGVVVVPAEKIEEAVVAAEEKASREGDVRSLLEAGRTVREVFDSFGIL